MSAYRVFLDLTLLLEVVNALGEDDERGFDALYTGNDIINAIYRYQYKQLSASSTRYKNSKMY